MRWAFSRSGPAHDHAQTSEEDVNTIESAETVIDRATNAIERTRWALSIRQARGERIASREGSRLAAIAVIEAMREPSEGMVARAELTTCMAAHQDGDHAAVFRAMIDAALSEGEG